MKNSNGELKYYNIKSLGSQEYVTDLSKNKVLKHKFFQELKYSFTQTINLSHCLIFERQNTHFGS